MKIDSTRAMNRASGLREAFDAFKARPGKDHLLRVLLHSQDTVYNLCYQVLRHAQESEDAAQQVFLELLDHLGEIPDGARFQAWVRRVSLHVALNRRRSQRRRWTHEQRAALMHSERDGSPPDDGLSIHEHLLQLDEPERSVLVAYFYEGKKLEALAADQGCSTTAMWKRLEKAKEALRQSLVHAGALGAVAGMGSFLEALEPVLAPAGLLRPPVVAKATALTAGGATGMLLVAGGLSLKKLTAIALGALFLGASLLTVSALGRMARRDLQETATIVLKGPSKSGLPKPPSAPASAAGGALASVPAAPPSKPVFKDVKEFWDALEEALLTVDDLARWSALRKVGIRLSDAEFQGALAKARGTKGRSRFAWSLFDQIVEAWTAQDPQAFLALFLSFPNPKINRVGVQEAMNSRTEAIWKATDLWSRRDAAGARSYMQARLDAIEEAVKKGAWPPEFNYGFDQRCDEIDARANPQEFGEKLKAAPDPLRTSERFSVLGRVWGERNPQEAVQWGSDLPTPTRWWFFEALVTSWARSDAQAALQWARGLFENIEGNSILRDAYEAASKAHPEIALTIARRDAQTSEAIFISIAQGWAATNPAAAGEMLLSRPRTAEGEIPGLKELIQDWAKGDDPRIVLDWVLHHAGPADRPGLLASLAAGWVGSSKAAAADALALAESVPSEQRVDVLRGFGGAWAAVDPVRAASWVQSTEGLLSRALSAQLAYQLSFHGQDSIHWARSLPPGEERDWALYTALTTPHHALEARRILSLAAEIQDPGLKNLVNINTALMRWPRNDFKGLVEWLETLPEVSPRPAESHRPLEKALAHVDSNYEAYGTREQLFASSVINAGHSRAEQEETIRNSRLTTAEKDRLMKRVADRYSEK
jgi:RNA polymerase sigma-70 factor (ECF subfamily)